MARLSIQGLAASLLLLSPQAILPVHAVKLDVSSSKWQTWGPYRPGLYFGVRPNIPETLLMGLMWANGSDRESLLSSACSLCHFFTHSLTHSPNIHSPP